MHLVKHLRQRLFIALQETRKISMLIFLILYGDMVSLLIVKFKVLVKHLEYIFQAEYSTQSLILSEKAKTNKAVPLNKVDFWRRIFGFKSDNTTLDFRRRFETILGYFDQMINSCQQLNVHAKSAIHIGPRLCHKPLSKFPLKHKDCAAEHRTMLQEFKDQGR